MIDKWLTNNEISQLLSVAKCSVIRRAQREGWPYRGYTVRGGKERRYHLENLPADIQTAYAASLKLSLSELQDQLKPASTHEKKIDIPRYAGRGAKTKAVRPMDATAGSDLKIAAARAKLIEAYNASGLSTADFITAYENGVAVPELRERLGRYGNIHTQSNFYG